MRCETPGCPKQKCPNPSGGYFNYCSRYCRDHRIHLPGMEWIYFSRHNVKFKKLDTGQRWLEILSVASSVMLCWLRVYLMCTCSFVVWYGTPTSKCVCINIWKSGQTNTMLLGWRWISNMCRLLVDSGFANWCIYVMYRINPWVSRSTWYYISSIFFTASTPNLQDPSGYGTCSLPGCIRPKYFDPANGRVHDFCGRTHTTQARAQGLCHSCLCNHISISRLEVSLLCHLNLEGSLVLKPLPVFSAYVTHWKTGGAGTQQRMTTPTTWWSAFETITGDFLACLLISL